MKMLHVESLFWGHNKNKKTSLLRYGVTAAVKVFNLQAPRAYFRGQKRFIRLVPEVGAGGDVPGQDVSKAVKLSKIS
jgi:hypothetical protein